MASAHPATGARTAPGTRPRTALREPSRGLGLHLGSVALVLALPVTFAAPYALPGTGTWWPAAGMLAAALLLAAPRARWLLHAAAAAVCAPCVALVYDTSLLTGLVSTVAVLLPAAVVDVGLRPTPEQRLASGPVRDFAGLRYHVVLGAAGVVCGVLGAGLSLATEPASEAALWGVSTLVGGATSMLLVLPLIAGSGGAAATGSRAELWVERTLVVGLAVALFVGGARSAALATAAFPLLGWAALRATRRETHVQVCGLGIAAYVATTYAAQLGTEPAVLDLPDAATTLPLHGFLASLSLFVVPLALAAERLSQARADAVRNADTMVRMLESASSTLFVLTDPFGRVRQFNEGAQRILGYTPDQVVGRSAAIFHSASEVAAHATDLGVAVDFDSVVLRQVELGEPRDWACLTADVWAGSAHP